jgi:hypothetical protein
LCVIEDTNIIRFIILVKYFAIFFQKKFAQQKSPAKVCRAVMFLMKMYIVALSFLVALSRLRFEPAAFRYGTGSFRASRWS